jgi:hypothetical protein
LGGGKEGGGVVGDSEPPPPQATTSAVNKKTVNILKNAKGDGKKIMKFCKPKKRMSLFYYAKYGINIGLL